VLSIVNVACNDSFFGRNILFCADQYCSNILLGSINNIISSHVQFTTVDVHLQTANFLSELLNIRDGHNFSLAKLVKRLTV